MPEAMPDAPPDATIAEAKRSAREVGRTCYLVWPKYGSNWRLIWNGWLDHPYRFEIESDGTVRELLNGAIIKEIRPDGTTVRELRNGTTIGGAEDNDTSRRIPETVELTDDEHAYLTEQGRAPGGQLLSSILRKVRAAAWAEGRIYGNEHGMKDAPEHEPEV